jgi:hypothetical protein
MMRSLDRTTKALALVASTALAVASGCVAEPEGALEESAAQLVGDDQGPADTNPCCCTGDVTDLSQAAPLTPPQATPPQAINPPAPLPPCGQLVQQQPIMQQPIAQQPCQQQPCQQQPCQQPVQQEPVQQPIQQPVGCAPIGCAPIGCASGGCFGARRGFFDDGFASLQGGFIYGGNPYLGPLMAFPAFAAGFFGPLNCVF